MDIMSENNYIHVDTYMSYEETISKVLTLTSKGFNASFCRIHDLDIYEVHVLKPTNSNVTLLDVLEKLKADGYVEAKLV